MPGAARGEATPPNRRATGLSRARRGRGLGAVRVTSHQGGSLVKGCTAYTDAMAASSGFTPLVQNGQGSQAGRGHVRAGKVLRWRTSAGKVLRW